MNGNHIVKRGETLSSVARQYGCTVQNLAALNHLANANQLQVGQSLRLPAFRQRDATKRPVDAQPPSQSTTPTPEESRSSRAGHWMREQWHAASDYADESLRAGSEWVDAKWHAAKDEAHDAWVKTVRIGHGLSDSLTNWYREIESFELIHHASQAKTSPRQPNEKAAATNAPKSASRKHRDEVLKQLRDRLYATPHVVATGGVKLSRNERKMIVAAVGLCEINNDVFGSENRDGEFHWKPNGAVSYSRIVHIGLSYGYIQFTQDGGNLGRLLKRMASKVKSEDELTHYFPNFDQLLRLCTDGMTDAHSTRFGKSGLDYWKKLPKAEQVALLNRVTEDKDKDGKLDHPLTEDEEIRGARVQQIPYVHGHPSIDLWEDYAQKPSKAEFPGWASAFKAAGDHPPFQDAQLELAVEDYFNAIAPKCRDWNIRSATGLAFVMACAVRGVARDLLLKVGKEKCGVTTRFETQKQEQQAMDAIATAAVTGGLAPNGKPIKVCKVGGVTFNPDEKHRMNILLKDEFDFLTEDLYDTSTYDAANDR